MIKYIERLIGNTIFLLILLAVIGIVTLKDMVWGDDD